MTLLDTVSEMLRLACKPSEVGMTFLSCTACRSERLFTPFHQSLGVDCNKGKKIEIGKWLSIVERNSEN